jgi:hypothetical protein
MLGFARKFEGLREADVRLANHRLQPLGHLTAARNLSIRHASTYAEPVCPHFVPEIVPASSQTLFKKERRTCWRIVYRKATVLFVDNDTGK